MRIVLVALIAIALSGCFGGSPGALSQEEADQVALSAVENFSNAMASTDGGEMRAIHGDFEGGLGDSNFMMGDMKMDLDMEWGRNDDLRIDLAVISGGTSIAAGIYCSADKTIILYGDQNYEQRGDDTCAEALGDSDQLIDVSELDDLGNLTAVPNDDGSVTATWNDDEGNATFYIDASGRITRMEMSTEAGSGELLIEYGTRRTLDVPSADIRIPVSIAGFGSTTNGQYQWDGYGWVEQTAPLNEIEIRVVSSDDASEIIHTFQAGQSSEAMGMRFTYNDDGDGRFSGNDTFTIDWPEGQENNYDVVLWDTWADAEVGANLMPGLGWSLIAAIGAAAFVARRRL